MHVPTLLLALALPLVATTQSTRPQLLFQLFVPFLGAKFSAQGRQQGDEQRERKAGLALLPTGHTGGFTASMKLPSGKCKNHTVTGGNVHLDSSQLPLFCFNHNHSFMWAVHYPCGEGVAVCFTELLNFTRPPDQPRAEHRTRNGQVLQSLVIGFNRSLSGGEEGKPLTNRPKNKCKGFLTLFSGPLYSPYEGKKPVGFKLHFCLLLKFRSQENI